MRTTSTRAWLAALCASALLGACAGDDDGGPAACAAGVRSLAFIAPRDGAALTAADDLDPTMGALQYDVRGKACGVDPALQVGLYMLDPVETGYAFTTAGDGNLVFTSVPLVPGTLRMQLRTIDMMVQSEIISFSVTF